MRELNIALILECLRRQTPLSRSELAQITGLTKATVSSLVQELLEAGTVPGEKGRPAILLQLNPDAGYILGAEIGLNFISVILANFATQVLWRRKEIIPDPQEQNVVLDHTVQIIRAACDYIKGSTSPVLGLGLGLPGLVNPETGFLRFAPTLGWKDLPLRDLFEDQLHFQVCVDTSARMAALGESYFGAGRGADFVLYLSLGVELNGGIVLNRRTLTGAVGLAGQVGHMTIESRGARCSCGNYGCWEMYASIPALFQRLQNRQFAGPVSSPLDPAHYELDRLSVEGAVEAARTGDSRARAALDETGWYVGIGLTSLINALNPQRVVLGGDLSVAHEFIVPAIQAVLQERALQGSLGAAEIVIAAHGRDACMMGGIAHVYQRVLSRPLEVNFRQTAAFV